MLAVTEAVSSEKKAEIEEQKIGLRIGEALTAEEVAQPDLVRAREKLRIATTVGCDVAKVTQFMQAYEMSRTMHGWLQERKKRGQPLPEGAFRFGGAGVPASCFCFCVGGPASPSHSLVPTTIWPASPILSVHFCRHRRILRAGSAGASSHGWRCAAAVWQGQHPPWRYARRDEEGGQWALVSCTQ